MTVAYRSVSQYKTYTDCPYRYYLERVLRCPQRPAAWLAQGIADHAAFEAYERSQRALTLAEMEDVYTAEYDREINRMCEEEPDFDSWFASGPYGGRADTERRYQLGLDQCARYVDWYEKHPEEVIWIAPDGTPGIELGFDIELDGVRVKGYIDAVMRVGLPDPLVIDNKTGNLPGDEFQLATYAVALNKTYGTNIRRGRYWMGKTGKPTMDYELAAWSEERLTDAFGEMNDGVLMEDFDPDPEPAKCRFCSVASSCKFAA
jgi:putative RecB family exonuclease